MVSDLKIDLDQLNLLRIRLDRVLDVIGEDSDIARETAWAVGHAGLASTLEHFSSSWRKHRLDIRDNLSWLEDSVDKIGQSFTDVDTELSSALEPQGSGDGPSSGAGVPV